MRPGVSFVVPTFNSQDLLVRLIPQLETLANEEMGDEILVVDDCGTDATIPFLSAAHPRVSVHRTEQNGGFSVAANLGVRAARNPVVMLLNPDITIAPDFPLDRYVAAFTENGNLFSVTPKILRDTHSGERNEAVPEVSLRWGGFDLNNLSTVEKYVVPRDLLYPCGGASLIDREKFLYLGGFDTLFSPFYFEDFDLGLRAWRAGWVCRYFPQGEVRHAHQGTIGKLPRRKVKLIVRRNYFLLLWKHFPARTVAFSLVPGGAVALRAVRKYDLLGMVWAASRFRGISSGRRDIERTSRRSFEDLQPLFLACRV